MGMAPWVHHLGAFGEGGGLAGLQHVTVMPYPCQGTAQPLGRCLTHALLHVMQGR